MSYKTMAEWLDERDQRIADLEEDKMTLRGELGAWRERAEAAGRECSELREKLRVLHECGPAHGVLEAQMEVGREVMWKHREALAELADTPVDRTTVVIRVTKEEVEMLADALRPAFEAAGLAVVPREPTKAMLDTAVRLGFITLKSQKLLWEAMVDAGQAERE